MRITGFGKIPLPTVVAAVVFAVWSAAARGQSDPYAPQSQESLRGMFAIAWHKGPDLPQGFQDSDGGILENTLITVGGFCQGQTNVPGKETKYPRGFLNKAWGLNLAAPQTGWQSLPDFPGDPRQELSSVVVGNGLYCWGGFSYSSPYCYSDGYRLTQSNGQWAWSSLPSMPRPLASCGVCAIGSKIYAFGGSDYDANQLYTNTDRNGNTTRLGARLLVLDTNNLAAGWSEAQQCPGTPRFVQATAAVNGKLYVLGGATGNDNSTGQYTTVVDNWQYDPAADAWTRLRDLPVSTGNFPAGGIVYDNRYILLVGGAQYANVTAPDGSLQPAYGTTSKYYSDNPYNSDVFVYDTLTNLFGTATGLPLNNNLPMTVVDGNKIYLIGGETGACVIDGESFGHHTDLFLTGTIEVLPEPSAFALVIAGALGMIVYWHARTKRCRFTPPVQ